MIWHGGIVGGKISGNKCVHYGFQEFEIASHYWTSYKANLFIIDSWEKISLDEKSLEIIFWTLYL